MISLISNEWKTSAFLIYPWIGCSSFCTFEICRDQTQTRMNLFLSLMSSLASNSHRIVSRMIIPLHSGDLSQFITRLSALSYILFKILISCPNSTCHPYKSMPRFLSSPRYSKHQYQLHIHYKIK